MYIMKDDEDNYVLIFYIEGGHNGTITKRA